MTEHDVDDDPNVTVDSALHLISLGLCELMVLCSIGKTGSVRRAKADLQFVQKTAGDLLSYLDVTNVTAA